jgi:hypothetical protein
MINMPPEKRRPVRVAVFSIPAVGHVNPMLAVTAALAGRNDVSEIRSYGPRVLADSFQQCGATHETIRAADNYIPFACDLRSDHLARRSFVEPLADINETIRRAAAFSPDIILADPFSVYGYVASHHLAVRYASLITFPGFGSLGESFATQYARPEPSLMRANEVYKSWFELDILGRGCLPVFFPSTDLSLVTTIESLSIPVDPVEQPMLHKYLGDRRGTTAYVGPCHGGVRLEPAALANQRFNGAEIESTAPDLEGFRPDCSGQTWELLNNAKRDGKKIILFSLGTVITDFRFLTPVGGAPTGRAFLTTLLRHLIEGFGGSSEFLVIAAVGHRLPPAELPLCSDNVVYCRTCPQLTLLQDYVDIFLTHHGANSTSESILSNVPMVSLPGAGDQIPCAQKAIEAGVAIALWDLHNPFATCTPQKLEYAVRTILSENAYAKACADLRSKLLSAGGAAKAARLVVSLYDSRQRPQRSSGNVQTALD